ncbi:MAG: zf-HC2 domain-containing protein [Anaerolineae bacterium]
MKHLSSAILDAYTEGSLDPAERLAADAHLAVCAECRLMAVSLAEIGDLLRTLPRVEPPASLSRAIIAEADRDARRRVVRGWATVALNGVALAVAWFMLIILGGETLVAAYNAGLSDFAGVLQTEPGLILRYPGDILALLAEAFPIVPLALTLVVLGIALWLMQRFFAELPQWTRTA